MFFSSMFYTAYMSSVVLVAIAATNDGAAARSHAEWCSTGHDGGERDAGRHSSDEHATAANAATDPTTDPDSSSSPTDDPSLHSYPT